MSYMPDRMPNFMHYICVANTLVALQLRCMEVSCQTIPVMFNVTEDIVIVVVLGLWSLG